MQRTTDEMTSPLSRADTSTPELRISALEQRLEALEAEHVEALGEIAELKARDQLKTQFISNISHDLRTPLTAVITHAEILRDGILGPLSDRQLDSISGIINGGRQLLAQVGEILSYARGAANQLTITRSEFELREVIAQQGALHESLASKKGVTLETYVPNDLSPVTADREKVAHIVGNLLGNAIDFTPPGGRVWVRVARADGDAASE